MSKKLEHLVWGNPQLGSNRRINPNYESRVASNPKSIASYLSMFQPLIDISRKHFSFSRYYDEVSQENVDAHVAKEARSQIVFYIDKFKRQDFIESILHLVRVLKMLRAYESYQFNLKLEAFTEVFLQSEAGKKLREKKIELTSDSFYTLVSGMYSAEGIEKNFTSEDKLKFNELVNSELRVGLRSFFRAMKKSIPKLTSKFNDRLNKIFEEKFDYPTPHSFTSWKKDKDFDCPKSNNWNWMNDILNDLNEGAYHFRDMLMNQDYVKLIEKNKLSSVNTPLDEFLEKARDIELQLEAGSYDVLAQKQSPTTILFKISDDVAWFLIDADYCEFEEKMMIHCGREEKSKLLSLRFKNMSGQWIPAVTASWHTAAIFRDDRGRWMPGVINGLIRKGVGNGYLTQIRGRNNSLPKKEYYPYIKSLLLSPFVDSIKPILYKPETSFKLTNLTPQEQQEILKVKPYMNDFNGYIENLYKIISIFEIIPYFSQKMFSGLKVIPDGIGTPFERVVIQNFNNSYTAMLKQMVDHQLAYADSAFRPIFKFLYLMEHISSPTYEDAIKSIYGRYDFRDIGPYLQSMNLNSGNSDDIMIKSAIVNIAISEQIDRDAITYGDIFQAKKESDLIELISMAVDKAGKSTIYDEMGYALYSTRVNFILAHVKPKINSIIKECYEHLFTDKSLPPTEFKIPYYNGSEYELCFPARAAKYLFMNQDTDIYSLKSYPNTYKFCVKLGELTDEIIKELNFYSHGIIRHLDINKVFGIDVPGFEEFVKEFERRIKVLADKYRKK